MAADYSKFNIHQKMVKIVEMTGVLQKNKEAYGYNYVPEEDIQAKVTAGMQTYGVMVYPTITPGTMTVTPMSYEKYDKKLKANKTVREYLVTAEMVYKWVNADNPDDFIDVGWILVGSQEDPSMAFGSGATYCNRYALLKAFQIATTSDDPDSWRSKQKEAADYEDVETLKRTIKSVVDKGSEKIASGVTKEAVKKAIAACNSGNENPNAIKNIVIAEKALDAVSALEPTNVEKKSTKTKEEK